MDKKDLLQLLAVVVAAVMSVGLASCSSDDDDGVKGGSANSKRIAKITYSNGASSVIGITLFEYDSQGRVVEATETETYSNTEKSATTAYTYADNTIISKTRGDWNNGRVHTFVLRDGRVVKDVERSRSGTTYTYEYIYDDKGYVVSQDFTDDSNSPDSGMILFTWTDGDLTKISKIWDDGNSYTLTITYSNIPWPANWHLYWNGTNMDRVLEPLGAWGKMPKHLPTKFERTEEGKNVSWTIDYTKENGQVTKAVYQYSGDLGMDIYTYEWE